MKRSNKVNYYVIPGITFQHVSIQDYIVGQVCKFFEITPQEMRLRSRKERYRWPRQICQVLLDKYSGLSLTSIAKFTGVTNHATVYHAKKVVEDIITTSKRDHHIFTTLESYVLDASNAMLQNVLRICGEHFMVAPIKILEKGDPVGEVYKARCMAIWLMQSGSKLNNERLATMFNCRIGDIVAALDDRVRFANKDLKYLDDGILFRDAIVGSSKTVKDEVAV